MTQCPEGMNLWNTLLIKPLAFLLLFLYSRLGENFGLAIIALTVLLRILLFPLTLPALRSVRIQQELKPKLAKLKMKYKDDPQKFARAQLDLFRQAGVNPFAGCLPQIIQLLVLVALYQVFITFLTSEGLNTQFVVWDLSKSAAYFFNAHEKGSALLYMVLPLLAAITQFFLSKIMMPAVSQEEKVAKATKGGSDDFAAVMQKQNLYLFPLLTLVVGYSFPAGLMLYWFISSLLQLIQQWWTNSFGHYYRLKSGREAAGRKGNEEKSAD